MKVLIFANCHGGSYLKAIKKCDKNSLLDIEHIISYSSLDKFDSLKYKFQECDVLITQPVTSVESFSLTNLKSIVKNDCLVFVVPFIRFHGFWDKDDTKEMKNFSSESLMFFPDVNSVEDCDKWLIGNDVNVESNFQNALVELKESEKTGDVKFVDFFLQHYKTHMLFLDPWHPSHIVTDFVSAQIVQWLASNIAGLLSPKFVINECGLYFRHYKPIQDSVAKKLQLAYDLDGYYKYKRKTYLHGIVKYESLDKPPLIDGFLKKEECLIEYENMNESTHLRSEALILDEMMNLTNSDLIEVFFNKYGSTIAENQLIGNISSLCNPIVLHCIGDYFLSNSKFKSAIPFFQKKNGLKETTWGWLNLSRSLFATGAFDEGVDTFKKSLTLAGISEKKMILSFGCKAMMAAVKEINQYNIAIELIRLELVGFESLLYSDLGVCKALERVGSKFYTVRTRLQYRLDIWYKNRDLRFADIIKLSNKVKANNFARSIGIRVPREIFCDRDIEKLNLNELPESYCIKPDNGADSKGVMVVYKGVDNFTSKSIDKFSMDFKSSISDFVLNAPHTNSSTKILIEEYMEDSLLPGMIPLDYKVHCYGGKARFFQVINRNANYKGQGFYDRDWNRLGHIIDDYPSNKDIPKPENLSIVLDYADKIASKLRQMVRVDFYLANDFVYFGEVTTYPAAGLRFTDYGNSICIQFWELFPDSPNLYEKL